ncbi:MAG TPA: aminotransferase class I/II-fold pyridoxal phosphate-dependent enzyme, partial [Chloroflexota bacterium]|nr:aminotransferase class I/II-fold pyridoxal phosphate-dependent enzyme [Chloroflexota bacterium]
MAASSRAVERLSGSQRNLADRLPRPRTDKMIGLHRGDPSFDTPRYIVDAAVEAMNQGFTHYPPPQGDPALREAIAAYQSAVSGVSVDPSHVLVTSGGTGAVYAGMVAFLNEGDELLLLDPTYSLYSDVARVVGARIVSVPLAGDFSVDLEAARRSVTPRTR